MDDRRKQLWIAMSNLWLDTELSDETLSWIADAVRESGLDREELEVVFRHELAPFLGPNLLATAGEWEGFDPDWVCVQAQKRYEKRTVLSRLLSTVGLTTFAARPAWERVLAIAFGDDKKVG